MKKILSIFFVLLFSLFFLSLNALAVDKPLAGTTINVFNWGEYISDGSDGSMDVIAEFTKKTGIKVNLQYFESNESMYNMLKGGGVSYDVIVPSDYMVERLIAEDMLEKINYDNIPNYHYIDKQYQNLYFDKTNEYNVPYNIGTVVLIYNAKMVKEKPTSWDVLWDEQYANDILMFNNPRDSFAIAQAKLGIDPNSNNPQDWQRATDELIRQKPLVKRYVMDEIFDMMEKGEAALAPYYAGDYEIMKSNNSDLDFVFPEEGVNFFVDALCIPKGAKNKAGAEVFINFMLEPEVALANAETIGYASAHTALRNMEEYTLKDSKAVYPDFSKLNTFEFYNLPQETLDLSTTLWGTVKQSNTEGIAIYIMAGVIVGGIIIFLVLYRYKKSRQVKYHDV